MATVSNIITLGKENTVQIGNVPDRQHANVIIKIGDKEIINRTFDAGIESFKWNLTDFVTKDTDGFTIFDSYFSSDTFSVSAKMIVTVFFSTGVKNLLRGGEHDIKFQLVENENTKPSINSVTLSVSSDKGFTQYIQGKAKVKSVVEATGKYEATIKSVTVKVDGSTCKEEDGFFLSGWLCLSGDRNVVVTVVDSRGFKNTYTDKIYVEPYAPPVIVPMGTDAYIKHGRWNPNTDKFDDTNGTQCRINFGVYASYIEGINDSLYCSYRYKIANETDFAYSNSLDSISFTSSSEQTDIDLLIYDNTITDENGKEIGPFGIENEYLVELTVTDLIGEKATKTFRLGVSECIAHFLNKRFSVGKYATKDELLDSAWTIHTDKNISADGKIEKLGEALAVEFGGTGAASAEEAREKLGITLKNLGVSASTTDLDLLSGAVSSGVTVDNIKKLYGLSGNVQDQLNDKAESDHTHTGFAPSSHEHSGYASENHEHDIGEITTSPTTICEDDSLLTTILSSSSSSITLKKDECWVTVWGKICEIYITFTYNQNLTASTDFDNIEVGTLTDKYKPNHYVGCHSGGGGFVASGEITPEGVLRLGSVSSDVNAGHKISLTATYLLP